MRIFLFYFIFQTNILICVTTNDIGQITVAGKRYLFLDSADAAVLYLLHDAFLDAAEDGCRLLGDRQCRVLGHAVVKGRRQGGNQSCDLGQIPGNRGDFLGYGPRGLDGGLEGETKNVGIFNLIEFK